MMRVRLEDGRLLYALEPAGWMWQGGDDGEQWTGCERLFPSGEPCGPRESFNMGEVIGYA